MAKQDKFPYNKAVLRAAILEAAKNPETHGGKGITPFWGQFHKIERSLEVAGKLDRVSDETLMGFLAHEEYQRLMALKSAKPKIQLTLDPDTIYDNRKGCWRARFARTPLVQDRGTTAKEALENLLNGQRGRGLSDDRFAYQVEYVDWIQN